MDIVEKLRRESSSGHVAYTEFILKLKRRKDCLFCFFEGKDDNKYYGIRIDGIYQGQFLDISCDGKESVIAVKDLIETHEEYKNIQIAYFLDRDFDEPVQIKHVYCIPSYSIENQYSTINALARILKNEFSLNEEENDFSRVLLSFEALKGRFHEEVIMINAWLACQSDKRKALGIKTRLKIDSTIGKYFKSIVNSDLTGIRDFRDLNSLEVIHSIFPDAPKIEVKELTLKITSLRGKNPDACYRGKFELLFFIDFLDKLKSEICRKAPAIFDKKRKCSLRFEQPSALTILSIYAETPRCLVKYLSLKRQNAA
jgi:hypothetical protein